MGRFEAHAGKRETRWLTPRHIVDALGDFDLDPAGAPGYELAEKSYVPEDGHDGLIAPWHGRVWLNPPYGREMEPFLQKLADHGNGVAIVFARTDAKWFRKLVWERATATLFFGTRLTFLDAFTNKPGNNSGSPSVLVAYGADNADTLSGSGLDGFYLRLRA